MAAEMEDSLCDEPDDDFFDTFFDDGVLETIGEVLSNPKGEDVREESSSYSICGKVLKNPIRNTNKTGSEKFETFLNTSKYQESILNVNDCEIIDICSAPTNILGKNLSVNTSSEIVTDELHSSLHSSGKTTHSKPDCVSDKTKASSRHVIMSGSTDKEEPPNESNSNCPNSESSTYFSVDELLAKVKNCLRKAPASKVNESDHSEANLNSSSHISHDSEFEKRDLMAMVKKCLKDTPPYALNVSSEKKLKKVENNDKECQLSTLEHSEHTAISDVFDNAKTTASIPVVNHPEEEEEGEITGNCSDTLCVQNTSTSTSSVELTPSKNICSDTESKMSRDDTEKENDLISDDVCSKKCDPKSILEKRNKIKINLKTQILASTTILNSKSSCTSKEHSSSPGESKLECASSKSPSESKEGGRKVKKRKRDNSRDRELCEPESSKHRSREKSEKRRKKRRDDSLKSWKSSSYKKKKEKYRRSRSRSPPHYSPTRQKRRVRSPDHRKRNRSISRSVSKSPSGRYGRRSCRSPLRCRSRSRSRSPLHYRSWKSPSPGIRRSRSSRSKSRSPFINEIKRLKKQWEREDKEKRTFTALPQLSPNSVSSLPSSVPTWNNETSSTTIVRNMVSVSVESVQLHSTSFPLGNPNEISPGYQAHPTPSEVAYMGPHFPSNLGMHYMQPGYRLCNEENAFFIPPHRGYPSQPEIPGLGAAFQTSFQNPLHGTICSNLPLPANDSQQTCVPITNPPIYPPSMSVTPSMPLNAPKEIVHPLQSEPPQSTSVLRKQLDILKSTIVDITPLPSNLSPRNCNTVTGTKKTNCSLVQIDCEPLSLADSDDNCTQTTNQASIQIDSKLGSSPDSETPSQPLVQTDCELISSPDSSISVTGTKKSNCSLVQIDCDPVSSSDSESMNCSASGPLSLTENEADKKVESTVTDSDACAHLTQLSSDLQKSSVEVALTEHNSQSNPSQLQTGENGKQILEAVQLSEHYDSDVIIEEMPLKPAPEVICISGDDGNDDSIYDLDLELNKIHDDILKSAPPESLRELADKSDVQRKRKRKRRRNRTKNVFSCFKNDHNYKDRDKEHNQDLGKENAQKTSDDCDPVLKECREMIDTLRIGRFVVSEDDETAQPVPSSNSGYSNSPLCEKPMLIFSYTQQPQSDEMQKMRDACTNTPFRLCIDVCTSTDYTVEVKDVMSQTDFGCLGCKVNMDKMEVMNAELEKIKKERDELLSIVLDIGKAHTIPGLSSSAEERKSSGCAIRDDEWIARQNSESLFNTISVNNRFFPEQSNQSSYLSCSTADSMCTERLGMDKCESFTNNRTDSILNRAESIPGEPILAYEYNHSSPVPFELQSQVSGDEYCGPFRSH